MYRYLDRPVSQVAEPQRFLLAAMRVWVERVRTGICPCASLGRGFAAQGYPQAVRDFGMAMAALDNDALGMIRFGACGSASVCEDEARLLSLFDAALQGDADQVRRLSSGLVVDDAVPRLATAVEWVALHLSNGRIMERRL